MRFFFLFVALAFTGFSWTTARSCAADTFAYVPKGDGTIARFRVNAKTGELISLAGAKDTGINRPVSLVLSVDKKFLYAHPTFDDEKDDRKTPTALQVLRLQEDGSLRLVQVMHLPSPIGQLVPHPGGRFVYALTDAGVFLLSVNARQRGTEPAGGLHALRHMSIPSGMAFDYWTRDGWQLTFSPSGNTLYDHYYSGFSENGSGFLQRFRVNRVTGALYKDGEEGTKKTSWGRKHTDPSADKEPLWEGVWCFVNRTAFLTNWDTFRVCRIDANERILAKGSLFALTPNKSSNYGHDPVLLSHPKLPIVIYAGSAADPYTIWRVSSPGHVVKVGEFASAYDPLHKGNLFISPDGKFLYETSRNDKPNPPRVTVLTLSSDGAQATPKLPPAPLPVGLSPEADAQWIFVTLPSKDTK